MTPFAPACEDPHSLALLPARRFVVGGVSQCQEEDAGFAVANLAVYHR